MSFLDCLLKNNDENFAVEVCDLLPLERYKVRTNELLAVLPTMLYQTATALTFVSRLVVRLSLVSISVRRAPCLGTPKDRSIDLKITVYAERWATLDKQVQISVAFNIFLIPPYSGAVIVMLSSRRNCYAFHCYDKTDKPLDCSSRGAKMKGAAISSLVRKRPILNKPESKVTQGTSMPSAD